MYNFIQSIMSVCALSVAAASKSCLGLNQRPLCKINVQGYDSTFLYDSGAQITLMSETEFRKIKADKRPPQMKNSTRVTGVAQNSMLQVKGVYPLTLTVKGRSTVVPVFVVKNMTQRNILGIDAISNLGLNYHAKSRKIYFCLLYTSPSPRDRG